ncbi:Biotin carboxyl carrier protein of acetyl-CoA carboxylase 1 [Citrus sinensis]|nr:Biotin carboxyl carrier protein of acetyl-CoA carboxylase 1 [Citrus sinensis]
MASSSLSTGTPSASAFSKNSSSLVHYYRNGTVFFRLSSSKPKLRFFAKGSQPSWKCATVVKSQLNEVAFDGSSNASATPAAETKDAKQPNEPSPSILASEESISEFISQVSSLIKLVDSRDIVELQLKQLDCELIIRKKEALPQPPAPASMAMMHSPSPPPVMPPTQPAPAPTSSAPSASPAPPASPPSSTAGKSVKSSLPPLKCPMAGTFYRSPAPGEPPFVKVGDRVQKGQVLCIIEAMKLMNEIEADRSGTIVEIIAEDRKPVSVDTQKTSLFHLIK